MNRDSIKTSSHSENTIGTALLEKEDGRVTNQLTQGLANRETGERVNVFTNFRMASVSKQFTAAGIIILKKNKIIRYSDKITDFFPDFRNGQNITLWHLLTHTSGLNDYERMIPMKQKVQASDTDVLNWVSKADSLYFTPGSQYRYSNTAFCILTQIIEKVTGKTFSDFINENLFKPLEMTNSFIFEEGKDMLNRSFGYTFHQNKEVILSDQSLTSATKGDGCVYTSLADYQKWINAIARNALFNLKEELLEVNHPISGQRGLHYGLGWFNYNGEELYHTGSTCGFSNAVYMTLDGKNALVFFSNLTDNHAAAFNLFTRKQPKFRFEQILALTD